MHLTDKRLFNFDDSLYHALEITDGTAIEVNPDEMMAYSINKELENIQKGRNLKDILSEKDYKKYSAALAKKLNKPASEITEKDLLLEKNGWMADYLAKGEMPTFVDAYLFSTAKKQGKWVGGIEDITDQAGLLENIDKTDIEFMLAKNSKNVVDSSVEYMIKLYGTQDIEGMYSLSAQQDSAAHYALLTKRNIKMSYRIDSIAHARSMLFAIGAAHLAGDDGVIALLRKRGFNVAPVMGSRKINSKDYTYTERPIPWNAVTDKQGLYSVMMPGNPVATKIGGLVDAKFYFDLTAFSGYCTMAMISSAKTQNPESAFKDVAANMFKDNKNLKSVSITNNGVAGMEYVAPVQNMHARVQLYMKGNMMYVVMFYGLKKDSLYGSNAKQFFDSFVIKDIPTTEEKLYNDTLAGVVTTLPVQLEYSPQLTHQNVNGWQVTGYTGADAKAGVYVAKFDKRPIKGDNIVSDSLIFEDTRKGMMEKFKETKSERLTIGGNNAAYFKGELNGYYISVLNIVRGNHNVVIMAVGDSAAIHQPVYDNIINNVKFVPYKSTQWKSCTTADSALTVWAPEDFIDSKTDTTLSKNSFLSYDSSTSMNIIVSVHKLKTYTWYSSDSAFWHVANKKLLDDGDSLVSSVCSRNGDVRINEMVVKRGDREVFSRIKQYQYGKVLYEITLRGEKDVINSANVNKLMDEVQFNQSRVDFDVTKSRAALLISDLSSKDSAVVNEAYDDMKGAGFDSVDIPLLHECLVKKYVAPNDSEDSSAINDRAAEMLCYFASPSTIKFASNKYNKLTGDKKYLRQTILYLLSMIRTKESYDSLFSLIKANPKDELFTYFSYRVSDSLKLAANYADDMLSYLKDTTRGMQMVNVLNQLLDSSLITLDPIKKHESEFIALAKYDVSSDDRSKRSFDLMNILAKIKTPKSLAALRGYLNIKGQRFMKEQAAILLVKNNQPVSATVLNSIAADPRTRKRLYDDLKEIKKQALFPKLYLTQKSLSESDLYDIASDQDYDVKTIKFVAEKTATYHNKKYKFYLFKVTVEDDGGSYLGVTGGYDIAGKSVEPKEDLSSMNFDEEFDASKINDQFKKWLDSFNEEEE
jgi:uncharacterized protein YbaP (TraB family)